LPWSTSLLPKRPYIGKILGLGPSELPVPLGIFPEKVRPVGSVKGIGANPRRKEIRFLPLSGTAITLFQKPPHLFELPALPGRRKSLPGKKDFFPAGILVSPGDPFFADDHAVQGKSILPPPPHVAGRMIVPSPGSAFGMEAIHEL